MARPLRIEFPGACYHIMNRGNDRLPIFDTDEDSKLFIEKLADFSESYKVSVRSYCLMTNHFHLYLCTPEGNLSKFMQSLMTSFTVTKNRRDRRHRHLFQARFKSLLVDDEGYGSRVSRYIHLNPGMVKSVESLDFSKQVKVVREYSWSSYRAIIGLSKRPKWLDRNSVLCRWGPKVKDQQGNYAKYVEEGLLREIEDPFEVAVARSILGNEQFIDKYRRSLIFLREKINDLREQSQAKKLKSWVDFESLVETLSKRYQVASEDLLRSNYRDTEGRQVLIFLSSRLCRGRYSLTDLSEKLGISLGGMSAACYKMTKRLKKDRKLHRNLTEIEKSLPS